jgi:threonine aldolase
MMIDLRSDTFTKPSPPMLEAMFKAAVGDDVFEEDPTVKQLESITADFFRMPASLFCPSGTMTNQIAIKCHTQPGNEIICDKLSHVYIYEGGGIAFNSGCQVKPIDGDRGRIKADQVVEAINPEDIHKPKTALVSVENTFNRGGGSCYELSDLHDIKETCLQNNIKFHLDGARIWNAIVHKNENPKSYGEIFDSISVCLSKGLGAPIGSLLLGSRDFIKRARATRKLLGGGMRQAGYLAAAGIYAIENNISRLEEDHYHAKKIGAALLKKDFIGKIFPIETNMIIFEVVGNYSAFSFSEYLKENNIHCIPISKDYVRMVTHLHVTPDMVNNLCSLIEKM